MTQATTLPASARAKTTKSAVTQIRASGKVPADPFLFQQQQAQAAQAQQQRMMVRI